MLYCQVDETSQLRSVAKVLRMKLLEKIQNQEAVVSIIGLGYVGLPLAIAFLEKGYQVIGLDIDKNKIETLREGNSYLNHISKDLFAKFLASKAFTPSDNFKELKKADAIIICVPTPLNKFREPNLKPVMDSVKFIKDNLKKGQLIILESSTYPGTTDDLILNELEFSGLKANKDFYLAYSPEREDPGNKQFSTSTIPKIIGADTPRSRMLAKKLYENIITEVITVSSSRTAEATKLTENIFRSVNIALVNELKLIYDVMGIDIWEVIDAASTKPFGYMPFYPGPGLGGHCIPIDPFYLTYKAREYDVPTKFIELAGEINTSMPHFVLKKIIDSLNLFSNKSISQSKILIVGMAYKNNIDYIRESPSLTLASMLLKNKAKVSYHDEYIPSVPYIKEFSELSGMKSIKLTKQKIQSFDAILIITDHSYINFGTIAKHSKLIIDTRNAMHGIETSAYVVKA